MIKGIGQDYDAAWDYLDSVYGDPRFVADIKTQDILQFKSVKESEDSRFGDTLKEVGRENDMGNNHMLALIEQKMFSEERKGLGTTLWMYKERSHLEKHFLDDK